MVTVYDILGDDRSVANILANCHALADLVDQMPCGSTCETCPAAETCHSDLGEFDPAEMAAFLAGELPGQEELEPLEDRDYSFPEVPLTPEQLRAAIWSVR